MSNSTNDQSFTSILLIGLFLVILGMVFIFLLDMMEPIALIITLSMITLGFCLLVVSLDWLRQLLRQRPVISNLISFVGMSMSCLGLSFLIVYNTANPPDLVMNDFGFGWFWTSDSFVWVFIPFVIMLLGYVIYQIGSGSSVTQKMEEFDGIRCPICTRFLKQNEEISQCIHCGLLAHKNHFLEWVKNRGLCPKCKNPLLPEQFV